MKVEKFLQEALGPSAGAVTALLVISATAGGGEGLVVPAYPADVRDKPFEVNVVTCGAVDAGGPAACKVIYNDGPAAFADAASAAFEKCTFDSPRDRATIWFVFRLMRDTEVVDVSREPKREFEVAPELVASVAPTFPPGAPSLTTEVALNLFIGPDGGVWYAEQADDGADTLYVERALAAAREFKFEPAVLGGEPTATWYSFVIEFK
jgi:hypothetical protein